MKHIRWYIFLTCSLISFSLASYLVQISIFHRTEDTFFYMIQDIAFVPIQVLLVTFIISRLLTEREKRAMLKKLNMLIGAFYSEVGSNLIKNCSGFSSDLSALTPHLLVSANWSDKDFEQAARLVQKSDPKLDSRKDDLRDLRDFLENKRGFMLSLLANPNLLEHDSFTDLLWAVFHLSEELSSRQTLEGLPAKDYDHLTGDIKRAYARLLSEWLLYMKHLKHDYPYLFSLAIRMNPMDPDASPIVE
jgi:hypothetical protein